MLESRLELEYSPLRATIELPEPIFQKLRARAEQERSSIEALIIEAVEKEIGLQPPEKQSRTRITLPLIRSGNPGALRSMTNSEIDDLLG
jgi:hypothetical protein